MFPNNLPTTTPATPVTDAIGRVVIDAAGTDDVLKLLPTIAPVENDTGTTLIIP